MQQKYTIIDTQVTMMIIGIAIQSATINITFSESSCK